MSIGQRIKTIRQQQGMSIDDLAIRLGKNRTTIYRYENGDIENLPLGILDSLANALNTTPAYLMGWDMSKNEEQINYGEVDAAILKYTEKWVDEFGTGIFEDDEVEKIIQYARFLLSIRNK